MTFDFSFIPLVWVLTAAAAICGLTAWLLLSPFRKTASTLSHVPTGAPPTSLHPSLTVIVYAWSRLDELDSYLETLMRQNYDNFDVVLVYDSGASATAAISEHYAGLYDNLHFTFIPPESHNLSRRKLAITLGVKAATGDVVLITTANCSIPSDSWLSQMMEPFSRDDKTEVVLGYSRFDITELHGLSRWYRQFDAVRTSAMWLGYAIAGKPYRGDGYNLAFMRRIFFEQKGFAKTINLQTGDDDLFVNDITDSANTAVTLLPETILTTNWDKAASRMWTDRKERYDFTSQWLPKGPFVRGGMISAMQWGVAGCCVAAALLGLPSVIPAIISAVILILFWIAEILLYRRVASRLQAIRLCVSVPLFWLWHPVGTFLFRLSHRGGRKKNYTWQRRKRHQH